MIDFHCHLDLYPDPISTANECQDQGVGVLSVTTTPSAWPGTSRLAQERSTIRTALGLHPQLAGERKHELTLFDRYLPETRFVGEVGLDGSPACRPSWADQVEVFEHVLRRCEAAGNKILSIHSRRAATPVLDALDHHARVQAPILHWFSGTKTELRRAIDRGCWFSVGPSMLAGAKGRSLVGLMPRNKVLLETDGPFTQDDGKPLRPWDIGLARKAIAELWGVDSVEGEMRIRANETSLLSS